MAANSDAPKLQTERLVLRAWRDEDVAPWVEMSADPRVMEFFPSILTRAEAEKTAVRVRDLLARDGFGWWALEVKGGAPFIGVIALQLVPFDAAFTPAMEVGWRLAFEHWGNGYATEGAEAALRFGFETLGQEQIVAMTAAANLRSQHVMERLGMTRDPIDDFDHPRLPDGHPLRRHVLYRLKNLCAVHVEKSNAGA
jgi:RimJ/RimL family protein N-acetyltransferase